MIPPGRIVVTGAAGFLGRRLLRRLRQDHEIVAIDRRLPEDPADMNHPNVRWHQIDLADPPAVARTFEGIRAEGGTDYLVHLAAYYDFTGEEIPEYQRANVDALRLVLEASRGLSLKRFLFTSSVAACKFPPPGGAIDEQTPPLLEHIYSRTKKLGEEMVRSYAKDFPSTIVRFAAVFSDWCEYPPLYMFLQTWLSDRWNARILGGRGASAIPYLHVRDATDFLIAALARSDRLDPGEVVIGSPDGAVSHRELFEAATGYHFGAARRPVFMPKILCRPGIRVRDAFGRLTGSRPFEKPWMAEYIDLALTIDAARTRERLGWTPQSRLHILNRIPFMLENFKTDPVGWLKRNEEALAHHLLRPNFQVYELLERHRREIADRFAAVIDGEEGRKNLPSFARLTPEERQFHHGTLVRSLVQSIREGRRGTFMAYCRDLAEHTARQGFGAGEVVYALRAFERICREKLAEDAQSPAISPAIRDYLTMTFEFGIDQVLDVFEHR